MPRIPSRSLRGSALVMVLLLTTLFFLLAMAMIQQGRGAALAATSSARQAEARALAWAGVADARAKLAKDLFFGPQGAVDQTQFCYTEDMNAVDSTTPVGSYNVLVDVESAPLLRIRSEGILADRTRPAARAVLLVDLDMTTFTILRVQDLSAL